ncbi:ECF RNA polymerase sigma factor SigK [Arthrobacter sp. H20]|uniref:ECF RNA polymerase sigma factor SigK n=1 Tax=Arthrobacter sp. H20 TaxID=1267981 RepID=UPI0020A63B50|nr:ECF RNA polymerase sigma factor SigK [Arthrobacter sp. H20]
MDFQADHKPLAELLHRAGEGDRDAFTTFYQLTSGRVYGLARRVIIDTEIAHDVTQEIFLLVWQDAHKYNPTIGNPMAWLMTITHRRAVDKVRSEQARTDRDARWGVANHSPDYDVVAETVTTRIEAQSVTTCLGSLSPAQREAISLAYYNGLTYREVAERLSIPLPTIKTRIRDGLKHLRTCLDEGPTK